MIRRKLIDVSELILEQRNRMFSLMNEYYANMTRQIFDSDLEEKKYVILLENVKTLEIEGFSTQMTYQFEHNGENCLILFSGDTIISRQQWGSLELLKAFLELMFSLIEDHPGEKIFWFLISKGARTYKSLPIFFKEFYPRYDREQQIELKALVDALAADRFGPSYDRKSGIIYADDPGQSLKKEYEPVSSKRINPHVEFFYRSNPGYYKGYELACIAELSLNNLTSSIRRALKV